MCLLREGERIEKQWNTFYPRKIIIFTFMKFRFEVGILGMLLMTQYFLLEKTIQNMQTEFTSINFDNEDVDMITLDDVFPPKW